MLRIIMFLWQMTNGKKDIVNDDDNKDDVMKQSYKENNIMRNNDDNKNNKDTEEMEKEIDKTKIKTMFLQQTKKKGMIMVMRLWRKKRRKWR